MLAAILLPLFVASLLPTAERVTALFDPVEFASRLVENAMNDAAPVAQLAVEQADNALIHLRADCYQIINLPRVCDQFHL